MPKVLIVTVTKVEATTVLELFSKATGVQWERQTTGRKIYYSLGKIRENSFYMVQSEMGTSGVGGAILTIRAAIDAISPSSVIMIGIAFGAKRSTQQLGDILVSRQILCYELQKVSKKQRIVRGDRVTASDSLLNRFRSGDNDWHGAHVHFGIILSGEKLIADKGFRDELIALDPEAIGGEMEGAGLYVAANEAKVDWILVKGICDWADARKNSQAQARAARNAVSFVLHVFSSASISSNRNERRQIPAPSSTGQQTTIEGKILLIDDDPYMCRDLEKRIKAELQSCVVETTTDPDRAITLVLSYAPDLVLLDLELPDNRGTNTVVRGLSLLSEIKGILKQLPVVVMTAYDERWLVIEAMRLGAANYLIKSDTKFSTSLMRVVRNELAATQAPSSKGRMARLIKYRLENNESLLDLCENKLRSMEGSLILEKDPETRLRLKQDLQQLKKDIELYRQENQRLHIELAELDP